MLMTSSDPDAQAHMPQMTMCVTVTPLSQGTDTLSWQHDMRARHVTG